MDVFNVAAGVKTEHIEIARYETPILLAEQMGAGDVVEPLRHNLREEQATLEKLTRFAREGSVPRAQQATQGAARTETAQ